MCGAHPDVMAALAATNYKQTPGYGADPYSDNAKRLIREACGAPEAEVHFFVGGTQTNATVIDGLLGPYQGVIASELSHINVHEAGAIEAAGHKVITLTEREGKISPHTLEEYMEKHVSDETRWHMVDPGMVYLSFPTEVGTIYSLTELKAIRKICGKYNLRLYIDGARLGYGLASKECDVTLHDLADLCDAFYIGGTKQGALFGEALVAQPGVLKNFFTMMKLHGAVLAKGRLLGVQFGALFSNNLYMDISQKAVDLALNLRHILESRGYSPLYDSPTNQQFFTLPNEVIECLRQSITFEYWGPKGDRCSQVRFVTGWETTEEDVAELRDVLDRNGF